MGLLRGMLAVWTIARILKRTWGSCINSRRANFRIHSGCGRGPFSQNRAYRIIRSDSSTRAN